MGEKLKAYLASTDEHCFKLVEDSNEEVYRESYGDDGGLEFFLHDGIYILREALVQYGDRENIAMWYDFYTEDELIEDLKQRH